LTGDSAGANLVLSLLSHINHPNPSTVLSIPPIKLDEDLKGAVLISPWVDFDTSKDSFKRNQYKDCICIPAGRQWSVRFSFLFPCPPSSPILFSTNRTKKNN
jgi:acetyl esterase/lipase